MPSFPREYYERNALIVARDLLGARLVRQEPGIGRVAGRIVETEAYTGHDDLASHGRLRITPRNAPMWEEAGHTYVYRSRGIHWMLNAVVEPAGQPAAVLIRAIEPLEGLDVMAARRPDRKPLEWTSGPARLAQALDITGALNRADLTITESPLWIEPDLTFDDGQIHTGPRIGMGKTPEPWYSMPWRFWVADNPYVSR